MNEVELLSEGLCKKNIQKIYRIFFYFILGNITNSRSVLDSADKIKENMKDKRKNILCTVCLYIRRNNLRG